MIDGISIIVLTKDRPDFFAQCARSVAGAGASAPIVDRIVIQNGTDAETLAIAAHYGWQIVSRQQNLSFSAGNNLGARAAHGSHLFLMNNDATCEPETLAALWEVRERQLVGCLILEPNGHVNHAGMMFQDLYHPVHIGRGTRPEEWPVDVWCEAVTFAGVLIARALYRQLDGLDEGYWYSYEDVDFCLRAREVGVGCSVAVAARLAHAEMGTRTGTEDPTNHRRFVRRWPPPRITAALNRVPRRETTVA